MAFPVVKRQPPFFVTSGHKTIYATWSHNIQTVLRQQDYKTYCCYISYIQCISMYFNVVSSHIVSISPLYRLYLSSLFPSLSPHIYYINITLILHYINTRTETWIMQVNWCSRKLPLSMRLRSEETITTISSWEIHWIIHGGFHTWMVYSGKSWKIPLKWMI